MKFCCLLLVSGLVVCGELMARNYSPKVGEAGKARLEVLNEIHNPHTVRVLQDLGIEGMAVLDVGCGTGIVTGELAKLVGEHGTVVGIDSSEEQLEIARQGAQGLGNVEFVQLAAEDIRQLDRRFDLVYCRFLLCHLADAEHVLRQAIEMLQPGGRLFLEEPAGVRCFVSYPASEVYDAWAVQVARQGTLQATDFEIGYKLPTILQDMGCRVEEASMYQPMLRSEREKGFLTLGAIEIGDAYVGAGLMDRAELDQMISGLRGLQEDERYTLSGTRMAQVVARAPDR